MININVRKNNDNVSNLRDLSDNEIRELGMKLDILVKGVIAEKVRRELK